MTKEEAIRRIKSWNLDSDDMEVLSVVIPELHESEDEKFQKYILKVCKECVEANDKGLELSMSTTKKLLSYLEKQKEQKPVCTVKEAWKEMRLEVYAQASGNRHEPNYSNDSTKMFSLCDIDEIFEKIGNSTIGSQSSEWSDEEKDKLNRIERIIVNANAHGNSLIGDKEAIELQHFIHSLVKPVINIVEWSEDKEIIRQNGRLDVCYNPEKYGLCNKTESIKDATKFGNLEYERGVKDGIQSEKKRHWKPSEKQLIALRYYLNHVPYSPHKEHLSSLRDDCEKLFIQ